MYSLSKITLKAEIKTQDIIKIFEFKNPVSVSRKITFGNQSNAFHLPQVSTTPFSYKNIFIGDVLSGGSCNVDTISFCPHNLTHLETSAHILNQKISKSNINDIPVHHLQGLVYLIDLTQKLTKDLKLLSKTSIEMELRKISLPITAIAIKTNASILPQDYDFSDKNFLALSKDSANLLSKFSFEGKKISTLILDLPSTDPENDGGKLLAHRTFFELPESGIHFNDTLQKIIVELAHFGNLEQNYYYFIMTPAKIQTNAMITDILFYPLQSQN